MKFERREHGSGIAGHKKRAFKIIVLSVVAVLCAVGTVFATRWILELRNPDRLEAFQELIGSLGVWGFFVLLAIQYIQIVVAFIPGGPIQIVAGALYGPLLGLVICLAGTILASLTAFSLTRRFGQAVISLFVEAEEIKRYKFLQNEKRLETAVIVLFLIPGTPKDALTYLFALTSIGTMRFMTLATAARLPAMVTSIFAGDRIISGEWMQAGILFAVISAVSAAGILAHRKLLAHISKKPPS